MQNIRLYVDKNRISPYAMSVYVALKEKGLDFQEIVVDLDQQQQKSEAYQAICPSAKVPCLIVDNFSLFESWAITEYLEDAFPAPSYPALYPKEIQARAKCRALQALVKTDFMQIRQQMPSDSVFHPAKISTPLTAPITEEIQRMIMSSATALDIAEQARREGVNDLRRSGLLKVKQGLTSLDEVLGSTNQ